MRRRHAGLALSANQRLLYLTDAASNQIHVFSVSGDGVLVEGRIFATLESPAPGAAGGIKTDQAGNIYCAGPKGVWIFDEGGRHLGTIAVPETPANIGWGDDFKTLYVTAETSLHKIRFNASGTRTF
ncbi:MAG: SMP-30/gluconolactonase/LRE family protein [Opitutaceae bacterium]